jgi:hypothetical protein
MLGWNIYKLWSPDWWDNPQKVIQDIITVIKEIQEPKTKTVETKTQINSEELTRKEFANVKLQGITQEVIQPIENSIKYNTCVLEQSYLNFSDEFFDSRLQSKIISQINQVMETEAPISHSLLSKRILNAWGISRLGVRLNDYLTTIYSRMGLKHTSQSGIYFYWNREQEPLNYSKFRVPGDDDSKRNADDLAKEEIICGIKEVLTNQISLPENDLIREVAKIFGYARLGGNVEQAMKMGIDFALQKELVISKNERIVLR